MADIRIQETLDDYGAPIIVRLVADDDDKSYSLCIERPEIGLTTHDADYPNALMLSANLRDEIGIGPAMDILERNGVPRTHPLWDLNHSGQWER